MLLQSAVQTLSMHSPGGSTFLHEMTSLPPYWNYDVISKIQLWINVYFLVEQSCQILLWSNLKWRSHGLLEEQQEQDEWQHEISSWSLNQRQKLVRSTCNLFVDNKSTVLSAGHVSHLSLVEVGLVHLLNPNHSRLPFLARRHHHLCHHYNSTIHLIINNCSSLP